MLEPVNGILGREDLQQLIPDPLEFFFPLRFERPRPGTRRSAPFDGAPMNAQDARYLGGAERCLDGRRVGVGKACHT